MLKIILCAYTQSVFSGRKIEALLKDSIRMMWLAQGYEPSYRTINRFRVDPDVQEILRQLFVQFRCQLIEEKIRSEEHTSELQSRGQLVCRLLLVKKDAQTTTAQHQ